MGRPASLGSPMAAGTWGTFVVIVPVAALAEESASGCGPQSEFFLARPICQVHKEVPYPRDF